MREKILKAIEKNSRIDLKELSIMLGEEEIDVVNEIAAMEAEGIICGYHTLIDWEKTSIEKVSALIEVRVTPQRLSRAVSIFWYLLRANPLKRFRISFPTNCRRLIPF